MFLLMSGDPAVLNHGDKSVGQCYAVLELITLCFDLKHTSAFQIMLMLLCQQWEGCNFLFLQRWRIWGESRCSAALDQA